MIDNYRHKGLRKQLIDELRLKQIASEEVLQAFDKVPRHFFLDKVFELQAYSNVAFPIGADQTISHPSTVAYQTTLLELEKGMNVLEIGTGSGFQTCILSAMGMKVVSIERQKELYLKTKPLIEKMGFRAKLYFGDGYEGKAIFAPYDRVLVTCGAPFIPQALVEQLKIGGMLVIPVGEGAVQKMIRITRINETEFKEETFGDFSFVPMLENKAK